jgi:3-dehydroquinate dehydratase
VTGVIAGLGGMGYALAVDAIATRRSLASCTQI